MSEQRIHELKILPEYFDAIRNGKKYFELRKNDRDYRTGDILLLREWKDGEYTGRTIKREITYILEGCPEYGLMDGFCILAIDILHRDGGVFELIEDVLDTLIEAGNGVTNEMLHEAADKLFRVRDILEKAAEDNEGEDG